MHPTIPKASQPTHPPFNSPPAPLPSYTHIPCSSSIFFCYFYVGYYLRRIRIRMLEVHGAAIRDVKQIEYKLLGKWGKSIFPLTLFTQTFSLFMSGNFGSLSRMAKDTMTTHRRRTMTTCVQELGRSTTYVYLQSQMLYHIICIWSHTRNTHKKPTPVTQKCDNSKFGNFL